MGTIVTATIDIILVIASALTILESVPLLKQWKLLDGWKIIPVSVLYVVLLVQVAIVSHGVHLCLN